eukprot:755683-Hanusia_phi.AAC.3
MLSDFCSLLEYLSSFWTILLMDGCDPPHDQHSARDAVHYVAGNNSRRDLFIKSASESQKAFGGSNTLQASG